MATGSKKLDVRLLNLLCMTIRRKMLFKMPFHQQKRSAKTLVAGAVNAIENSQLF